MFKHVLIIIFAIIAFCCTTLFAQDTLTKIVLIDKIVLNKNFAFSKETSYTFLATIGSLRNENYQYPPIEDSETLTMPFLAIIKFMSNERLDLEIAIDDKESTITLSGLEKLGDTIHIPQWTMYHNCLADSINGENIYYHCANEKRLNIFKIEKSKFCRKSSCADTLRNIVFILNNASYSVDLHVIPKDLTDTTAAIPGDKTSLITTDI